MSAVAHHTEMCLLTSASVQGEVQRALACGQSCKGQKGAITGCHEGQQLGMQPMRLGLCDAQPGVQHWVDV